MHDAYWKNPIKPAHYYMQKVLPLVYDESLSYYEAVDKLVHKINEICFATNKLLNDDIALWIRRQLNEIFRNSYYIEDAEKLVMVLTPAEDVFMQDMYIAEDERFVFSLTYTGEVCDG